MLCMRAWGCPAALVVLLATVVPPSSTTTSTSSVTSASGGPTAASTPAAVNAATGTATTSVKHEPAARTRHAARLGKALGRLLVEDAAEAAVTPTDDGGVTPAKVSTRVAPADWEEFKRKHNKTYFKSDDLKRMARLARMNGANFTIDTYSDEDRMNMFTGRMLAIEAFNRQGKSFKRALNQFADLTPQEVMARHTGLLLTGRKPKGSPFDPKSMGRLMAPLPRGFDWREKGALTEPRNQAGCGCCWAFAATATLEAKNFIRSHRLVALSEQHLLDCDTLNEKCDGGTPWDAFDWVQFNGGQEENVVYPYEVLPDKCRQDRARMFRLQLRGYMSVRPASEENLMLALLAEGPLAVAVNAKPASFQDYREGVYSDPECDGVEDNLRHAMVLVGYGEDAVDGPYWTLRNSWGRHWGELGHIRVSRRDNLCGIATYAVFPVLNDGV